MHTEDELLPISGLQHLLFCERRAALVLLEGIWGENASTVEGHILHEKAHDTESETRRNTRIARGLRLRSLETGLTGKADVVEFRRISNVGLDGIPLIGQQGFWRPYPVEYKKGRLRREEGYEVQLCAQALCLEEMLGTVVPSGAIFYGMPKRRLEVVFDAHLRKKTLAAAKRLHELAEKGKTPSAEYGRKCKSCSLFDYCMPKISGRQKKVKNYMDAAIHGITDSGTER